MAISAFLRLLSVIAVEIFHSLLVGRNSQRNASKEQAARKAQFFRRRVVVLRENVTSEVRGTYDEKRQRTRLLDTREHSEVCFFRAIGQVWRKDSPFSHRTDTKRSLCYWQACVRWFDGNCNILQDPRVVLHAEQRSGHPWGIIPGNVELVLVIYCPHYDSGTTLHASVVKLYNTQYILVN